MAFRFFDRRVRFFGNRAVLVLCVIFFLVPFAMRGARKATEHLENNIKDWLPADFPETKDLEWFGKHFMDERFVLLTWPGCTEVTAEYGMFAEKIKGEIAPSEEEIAQFSPEEMEHEKVRQLGDKLGLFAVFANAREDQSARYEYYENWGGIGEKWLLGHDDKWYFIKPNGELYKWDGDQNVGNYAVRSVKKRTGHEIATGELIATVGEAIPGIPNEYHADPRKLTARLFNTVRTGPELLEELVYEDGPLWPRTTDVADEDKPRVARKTAYERLTGTLFGPAIHKGFSWETHDFRSALKPETIAQLPSDWEQRFKMFVDRVAENQYGGDRSKLVNASSDQQTAHWDTLFTKLRVDPPPRQTCFIITMSEAGKHDLARVIGRPMLGKPPGRVLALAHEAGVIPNLGGDINPSAGVDERILNLKMGGPPVDNVAIDEEGTITLVRLVGYSAFIGISLSLICFRSIKVTMMVFFVGGVAAIASLAIVFWSGSVPGMAHLSSVDAVLMSMPALVYVLGLSGAVHIVNYYREAVEEQGVEGAAERAIGHAWGPCTLAAFTTALGLVSLYSSNLMPIKKFGLFSALGVMATLVLLFCYLPAALTIWPFLTKKRDEDEGAGFAKLIENMWLAVGRWIIGHHWLVTAGCMALMFAVGAGLFKIKTDVQLLKLFDSGAKIIGDYHWLEGNIGKLVPMELVVRMKPELLRPPLQELIALSQKSPKAYEEAMSTSQFQLTLLERMQLVHRIQEVCEYEFGEAGQDKIGRCMSAATFVSDLPAADAGKTTRGTFNTQLERQREGLPTDYVRTDTRNELWRISERLGALNDVDYGVFIHEQKVAVEPVLTAYRFRDEILRELVAAKNGGSVARSKIGFLGSADPTVKTNEPVPDAENSEAEQLIDQTKIFSSIIEKLVTELGCLKQWHDPVTKPLAELADSNEKWSRIIGSFDCVVLIEDHTDYDVDFIRENAKIFIDARDHKFELGTSLTAAERDDPIQVVYTGVVPVVYKAQRTLLNSLVVSIGLAFVMIAAVMMVLLRDWRRRISPLNTINVTAGMTSMVPNVFPVVVIFGAMGHWGTKIDIGTMMCASVAMGVAVDDTIHFLTWFRIGLREGMTRNGAILEAYRRVGTAMTQTTLIGGLGLSVFALSTFTPTQRFGVMMVTLLVAALAGDLILLPAVLAGPLGRFFMVAKHERSSEKKTEGDVAVIPDESNAQDALEDPAFDDGGETPHSKTRRTGSGTVRADRKHGWPRH
ncbi:MAG: MMPL family transporter [Planctomycetes bacterium]|nr:MMPL family transporter [Planctomycetota bacterium]